MAAATPADVAWVFGWERSEIAPLVDTLLKTGKLQLAVAPELEAEVLVPKPWPGRATKRAKR
jgi:hypothetical protein